jgi:tight adherence protein B
VGAFIGLLLGLGGVLIWRSFLRVEKRPLAIRRRGVRDRVDETLIVAGIESVSATQLLGACVGLGVFIFVAFFLISGVWVISVAFASFAGFVPFLVVRMRARQRRTELRDLWPDVVDNLASSVRAGLALPEALTAIGHRGPAELRGAFRRFGEDYRATGRFNDCLDRLKASLADPVADRIIESLRIAREVGGSDLGRLLRTLSGFLREDSRTRSELEARQSWTVNGARLAVAAPWLVLAFLSTNRETIRAYNTVAGFWVIVIGAGLCFFAYRLMVRLGRLPAEQRVLR